MTISEYVNELIGGVFNPFAQLALMPGGAFIGALFTLPFVSDRVTVHHRSTTSAEDVC